MTLFVLFTPSVVLLSLTCHCTVVTAAAASVTTGGGGGGCRFPREWRGRYFQSGLGEIFIRDNVITTKGECVDHSRDYFLFHNRESNCYHCLLLLRQHRNIIQYKESYCVSQSTLKATCAQIRVESPLYTLVRDPSRAVPCPFEGAFQFRYNDLMSGFCEGDLASYARPCVGKTRYQLRFQHCVNSATFHKHSVELECLATWKDGSEMHFYGQLTAPQLHGKDNRYRCFKYQLYGGDVWVAMSADATCRGLRSATDGPFLVELQRDTLGWPAPACQFPDWLRGVTWRDLSDQSRYSIDSTANTLSEYRLKASSSVTSSTRHRLSLQTEYQCIQSWKLPTTTDHIEEYTLLTFTHQNCAAKRQCLKVRRLTNNAVQLFQGRWLERDSREDCFVDSFKFGQILVSENVTVEACTRRGVYHTTASTDGCLYRLTVGCGNLSAITVDSSCTSQERVFECVVSWTDNNKQFTVVQQQQQQHRDHSLNCLSFRQEFGHTVFGDDVTCSSTNVTNIGTMPFTLQRHENCRGSGPPVDNIIHTGHQGALSHDVTLPRRDVTSLPVNSFDDSDDDDNYEDTNEESSGRGLQPQFSLVPALPATTQQPVTVGNRESGGRRGVATNTAGTKNLPSVPSTSQSDRKLVFVPPIDGSTALHRQEPLLLLITVLTVATFSQ